MNSYNAICNAFDNCNLTCRVHTNANGMVLRYGGRFFIGTIVDVKFDIQMQEETIFLRLDNRPCIVTNCCNDNNMAGPYCIKCDNVEDVVKAWGGTFHVSYDILKTIYNAAELTPEYHKVLDEIVEELFKLDQYTKVVVTIGGFWNTEFNINVGNEQENQKRVAWLSCVGCARLHSCCGYKLKNVVLPY